MGGRIHRASPGSEPLSPGATLRARAEEVGRALLDIALPGRCLACSSFLGESRPPLCAECLPDPPWPPPPCSGCLGRGSGGDRCAFCRAGPPPRPLIRLAPHVHPLRTMILAAKWGDGGDRVPALARWLAAACRRGLGTPVPIEAVVAVPRSRWRRLRHGRPLSEALAGALAAELRRPLLPPPRRRGGPPQTSLDSRSRRRAPRGAFAVPARLAERIAGRTLLLVDDVVTTGATLDACAEVLESAGAKRVITAALTFAP